VKKINRYIFNGLVKVTIKGLKLEKKKSKLEWVIVGILIIFLGFNVVAILSGNT